MRQRGRQSAAAFEVMPRVDGRPERLQPRADAQPEVKAIFAALVGSVEPEHFRSGDGDLVEQYAQAIALARHSYAEMVEGGPVVDGKASPWLTVLEKAHRSAVALSARLRLSPQNRTDPKTAGREKSNRRVPWEEWRND